VQRLDLAGAVTRRRMTPFIMKPCREDLLVLKDWLESGRLVPVIEKRLPLSLAADAMAHVMQGHAHGKTVITTGGARSG